MSESLFKEFDEVSAKQWKQKIQYDLKGADYNKTLVWQSPEGIHVKPFYHQDDFSEDFEAVPGQPKEWTVAQEIFIDDEAIANGIATDAINRGAQAVVLKSDKEFNIDVLFKDFPFQKTTIYFSFKFLSESFYTKIIDFLTPKKAKVFYNVDIIGNFAKTGNWYHNLKQDHQTLETIIDKYPSESIISIDAKLYQNAGANIIQQLAYAPSHANEYLNHFKKLDRETRLTFQLAMGANYFFEIAKIRALRKLYAVLAKEYGEKKSVI